MIEMYREEILEHYKNPQNFGELKEPTNFHEEFNESCGDQIKLYLTVKDGIVKDVKFKGHGCAISMASCSIMTEEIKGKTIQDVLKIDNDHVINSLHIPISPSRMKCALLSLKAIQLCIVDGKLTADNNIDSTNKNN